MLGAASDIASGDATEVPYGNLANTWTQAAGTLRAASDIQTDAI